MLCRKCETPFNKNHFTEPSEGICNFCFIDEDTSVENYEFWTEIFDQIEGLFRKYHQGELTRGQLWRELFVHFDDGYTDDEVTN